jgi:flagellar biogenesis protein FliO
MSSADREDNMAPVAGWAGWIFNRLRRGARPQPSLQLVERITLAPRQSLALVEADGRRLLVATSPDGAPSFYALDNRRSATSQRRIPRPSQTRVSW